MTTPQVTYECATYQEQAVIFIRFEYNTQLIERVKKLTGARWCAAQKAWYVRDTVFYREKFGLLPKPIGKNYMENTCWLEGG